MTIKRRDFLKGTAATGAFASGLFPHIWIKDASLARAQNGEIKVGVLFSLTARAGSAQTPGSPRPRVSGSALSPTSTSLAGLDPAIGLVRDPAIAALLPDISPSRLRRIDSALVSFGTRQTNSDTLSTTRGIGAARRWIHAELRSYAADCNGCLRIEYDQAMFSGERIPVDDMYVGLRTVGANGHRSLATVNPAPPRPPSPVTPPPGAR